MKKKTTTPRYCKCGSGKKYRDCCLLEARELILDIRDHRPQLLKEIREQNENEAMDMATPDVRPLVRSFAAMILVVIGFLSILVLIVGGIYSR